MPGPGVCVGGCLRVTARGMAVGGRFRGASGTPSPAVCPGMGGSGSLPLIRPCGATFPHGGRQGLQWRDSSLPGCWRRRKVAAGWGHPALRMGIWKRPWGLRGHPFPGRRTVGAGHCGVVSVGPRLSGAKPGSEQCLPPRGKQPHERASFAGWRRSLCAAKRPARGLARAPVNGSARREGS